MNLPKEKSPSLQQLKLQARRIRADLAKDAPPISHSRSLEIIAHQRGFKDWNTLHASVSNRAEMDSVGLGQTVRGLYLGQPFEGEIVGIRVMKPGRLYYVSIQLEKAIDVVTFDSFTNFRKRLSCAVDGSGVSPARTSNGAPHMVLEL